MKAEFGLKLAADPAWRVPALIVVPPRVSISPGQCQYARTQVDNAARAADRSAKCNRIAAIEGQNRIIGDISHDATSRSTVPDLQCTSTDRCTAGVSIGPGQCQRARAYFCELKDARSVFEHSAKGCAGAVVTDG